MKSRLGIIVTEFFQISLITYLLLLLLEHISPGFVNEIINTSVILWCVLVSGIFLALPFSEKHWKSEQKMLEELLHHAFENWEIPTSKKSRWEWIFIYTLSYGGGLIIYLKTTELGSASIVFSIMTGVIILLLSKVILNEDE